MMTSPLVTAVCVWVTGMVIGPLLAMRGTTTATTTNNKQKQTRKERKKKDERLYMTISQTSEIVYRMSRLLSSNWSSEGTWLASRCFITKARYCTYTGAVALWQSDTGWLMGTAINDINIFSFFSFLFLRLRTLIHWKWSSWYSNTSLPRKCSKRVTASDS